MKIKTTLAAALLALSPPFAFAMGCHGTEHSSEQAMTCAEGTTWDAKTSSCVVHTG